MPSSPEHYPSLPFAVDRNSGSSLIDQVTDGFRRAIVAGVYPIDSTLPTFMEIASGLGVSMNVVRAAMGSLVDEGLLGARRGVGCVVKPNGTKLCLGRVIVVQPGGNGGYYFNIIVGVIRETLSRLGYFVTGITAFRCPGRSYDFSRLDIELREHVDMVVLISRNVAAMDMLVRRKVPFVVVGQRITKDRGTDAVGWVCEDFDAGMADVVAQCRRVGVRRVCVVHAWRRRHATFAAFDAAGIAVEDWQIPPMARYGSIEGVQRAGMEAFAARLARGKDWLPDLFVFSDDDILASGCLMALAYAGVRVPEDVRVVTLSNKGLGPVYPRTLARLEIDPASYGDSVARYVHSILLGKHSVKPPVLASVYVPGESFPDGHNGHKCP